MFAMSIYIRLGLESILTVSISVMSGFKNFGAQSKDIPSFITCIYLIVGVALFIMFDALLIYKARYDFEEKDRLLYGEYFKGLKSNTKSRMNSICFFSLRILLVILLVGFDFMPSRVKASLVIVIQGSYILYLVIVKPFDGVKDNLIECFNQITFLVLVFILLIFSEKRMWTKSLEGVYIFILFVSPLV